MVLFRSINDIAYQKNTVLTLGTFDGIHPGHQKIISELVKYAALHEARRLLVTFHPHPQTVLKNRADRIELLTPLEEKINRLEKTDLDSMLLLRFSRTMALMEPHRFIEEILCKRIGMQAIVVGYDHAFGKGRSGGAQLLKLMGNELDFSVHVVDPVLIQGEAVSSTKIRHYLYERKIPEANRLLGREYSVFGIVAKGKNLGSKLGFPTANLKIKGESKLLPGNGVYAVRVQVDGLVYPGMANLGTRPTVDGKHRTLEVHILDFDRNIYDHGIQVEFVSLIRDEIGFESVSSLISQMQKDRLRAQQLLTSIV